MLHLLRFIVRLIIVLLWIALGLVILAAYFGWGRLSVRDALYRWWSEWLLRWCGVRVNVKGTPVEQGGALLIANHVSWLDIFVLSQQRATIFVAKREIRQWPVLGWLVAGVGTIFIERGNRKAVHEVTRQMHQRFARGQLVGLFPEGTTSDGLNLLPFHAGLFEAALGASVAVQPVALLFKHHGQRSGFAAFCGEESLVHNVWRVFGASGVEVDVEYLPVVHANPGADGGYASRHQLSEAVRDIIRERVVAHAAPSQDHLSSLQSRNHSSP